MENSKSEPNIKPKIFPFLIMSICNAVEFLLVMAEKMGPLLFGFLGLSSESQTFVVPTPKALFGPLESSVA